MYNNVVKRVFDFVLAIILLGICIIPIIIISIAIKLEDGSFVFFKQERTGKNGKIFKLYKFRSMKPDNDVRNFSEEDKVTKVGKFLRKTSLDELPQIFNILKGEMSFIGPRPWIHEYYEIMNDEQRRRVDVRPGVTGLAQAKGRNGIDIFKKIEYDLEYVSNVSLFLDLKVVFLTIKTVLSQADYECGKGGIKDELDMLKEQNTNEKVKTVKA